MAWGHRATLQERDEHCGNMKREQDCVWPPRRPGVELLIFLLDVLQVISIWDTWSDCTVLAYDYLRSYVLDDSADSASSRRHVEEDNESEPDTLSSNRPMVERKGLML